MTDTFLDDQQIAYLADDLRSIAANIGDLAAIKNGLTSPPGGKAARNPRGYYSREPGNLAAMEKHIKAGIVLMRYAGYLNRDAGISFPPSTDIGSLAVHLQRHIHELSQQTWASEAAQQIRNIEVRIYRTVHPPEAKYIGPCQAEGKPQCRGLFDTDGRVNGCETCGAEFDLEDVRLETQFKIRQGYRDTNGTPQEVATALNDLGYRKKGKRITNKNITYWARSERLRQRGEVFKNGKQQPLFNIGETQDAADQMKDIERIRESAELTA